MGDLTKNFSRSEFACRGENCCGNSAPIDSRLIEALQLLRDAINVPLVVTSGFRCRTHNAVIGGVTMSLHTIGQAADLLPPDGMSAEELAIAAGRIEAFASGGIGVYPTFIHVDVRPVRSRWSSSVGIGFPKSTVVIKHDYGCDAVLVDVEASLD